MPHTYYNENDPYCAAWLRSLISQNLIAPGDVDERSIQDVRPVDLRGYTQCHFFAGIGGWSRALRLAAVPDRRAIWTGSCPCQPFSSAGARRGFDDERHLWPDWYWLIRQCRPATILGEQVASARVWFDQVRADLEDQAYACALAVLPACGVDAPHKRDRIWFVAYSDQDHELARAVDAEVAQSSKPVADPNSHERNRRSSVVQMGRIGSEKEAARDGVARRIEWSPEPAVGRVAHGVPARMAKLRAYGNAIVPQCAEAFIRAALT